MSKHILSVWTTEHPERDSKTTMGNFRLKVKIPYMVMAGSEQNREPKTVP
jgi:hypothetical protein